MGPVGITDLQHLHLLLLVSEICLCPLSFTSHLSDLDLKHYPSKETLHGHLVGNFSIALH